MDHGDQARRAVAEAYAARQAHLNQQQADRDRESKRLNLYVTAIRETFWEHLRGVAKFRAWLYVDRDVRVPLPADGRHGPVTGDAIVRPPGCLRILVQYRIYVDYALGDDDRPVTQWTPDVTPKTTYTVLHDDMCPTQVGAAVLETWRWEDALGEARRARLAQARAAVERAEREALAVRLQLETHEHKLRDARNTLRAVEAVSPPPDPT